MAREARDRSCVHCGALGEEHAPLGKCLFHATYFQRQNCVACDKSVEENSQVRWGKDARGIYREAHVACVMAWMDHLRSDHPTFRGLISESLAYFVQLKRGETEEIP